MQATIDGWMVRRASRRESAVLFSRSSRTAFSLEIGEGSGLLDDFASLRGPEFDPTDVARPVAEFYEKTADYSLDAWSEWCNAFRPFGWLLALLFSRRLQQLNVPLRPLDTSRGVTSEILRVTDPVSGRIRFTGLAASAY